MSAPKLEEIREESWPRSTKGTGKFKPYSYSSDFYIKIPEFITKTLQGKVISENKNGATYNFDYTKGIRVASIQWLVREWTVMIKDYIEETRIKKEKDAPRTKVIFFRMHTTTTLLRKSNTSGLQGTSIISDGTMRRGLTKEKQIRINMFFSMMRMKSSLISSILPLIISSHSWVTLKRILPIRR